MKNIYSILEKFGIEIKEDKKKDFEKELEKNYKTVSEIEVVRENLKKANETIETRNKDLEALKKQLEDAGTDSTKLKNVTDELESLKKTYADEKEKYESEMRKQAYEFAVKERVNQLKFSSNAAKKTFINDVIDKGLKLEEGKLLGFDDFVAQYKENDEGVFHDETQKVPQIGGKSSKAIKPLSKDEIIKIKNRADRQAAIADYIKKNGEW